MLVITQHLMSTQYTAVILKATYIEGLEQWIADESEVFKKDTSVKKDALQFEITIWSLVCLMVLVTIGTIFMSQ
jgi:hypothetical protein